MKTLEEMNQWNYKEALKYFNENAHNQYIPETEVYIRSLRPIQTIDLRKNYNARKVLLETVASGTLVLIDGPSNNGKTTLAKRISDKTGAEIVDIDLICKDWMDRELNSSINRLDMIQKLMQMNQLTDRYIEDHLEKIIKQKSETNRPVILVGMYLELVYRCIIVKTLGKYFNRVISVFVCENTLEDVQKLIDSRCEEFGQELPGEREKCVEDYKFAQNLIHRANGIFLSLGMNASFIVNTSVSDKLL